jgi:hypothetical protein
MPIVNWETTMRWKRVSLVALLIAIVLTFPLWYRLLNPAAFAQLRCVITHPDGTIEQAAGEMACVNNGLPTLGLRSQE